jgi:hypothetical protein
MPPIPNLCLLMPPRSDGYFSAVVQSEDGRTLLRCLMPVRRRDLDVARSPTLAAQWSLEQFTCSFCQRNRHATGAAVAA